MQKLRQETRIARCPNQPIGCLDKEATVIFPLKYAVKTSELILPSMPCRCQADRDILYSESILQFMSEREKPHILHQRIHIGRRMKRSAYIRQPLAGRFVEMVVIAVCYQYRVQRRHHFRQNGRLYQRRHIEAQQHRIDHDTCAPAVDKESSVPQPADDCMITRGESLLAKVLRGKRISLSLICISYLCG